MPPSARKGFTLVELLVVISIIAILSVIGLTIFTGVQKSARDAKRKGDIDAISKAMEANYSGLTGKYVPLADTMFASGKMPQDPLAGPDSTDRNNKFRGLNNCSRECYYCSKPNKSPGNCGGSDERIWDTANAFPTSNDTKYLICANLESGTPTYYCRSNQQ